GRPGSRSGPVQWRSSKRCSSPRAALEREVKFRIGWFLTPLYPLAQPLPEYLRRRGAAFGQVAPGGGEVGAEGVAGDDAAAGVVQVDRAGQAHPPVVADQVALAVQFVDEDDGAHRLPSAEAGGAVEEGRDEGVGEGVGRIVEGAAHLDRLNEQVF